MKAVSYISREEALAEAKQYFESIGEEFDDDSRKIVLAIHDATESAYRRGFDAGTLMSEKEKGRINHD